jgi:exodeoxyribonuclease V alpha subunit
MKVYAGAPAGARRYLEADRGRADDYYLTEGTGVARRFTASPDGPVAELPALSGEHYEAWVAGLDPDTGMPRGRLRTDDRAVRFVEVVVNGPKSWSLAAALHPDIAVAYDAAQDRAATQIIGWLAHHATTRVGPAGGQVQVPVERLEAVTVRHYTSRAGDPHRHLHLQINARVFAAGKWRGLHTIGVRDSLAAINGIGHAAVATDPQFRTALAAHGYTLDGSGEILQLAEYVGPFSARALQIGRNTDRYEREWTVAHPGEQPGPALHQAWDRRAWAEDRPDKVIPRPSADVSERWLGELAALGYRDRDIPVALTPTPVGGLDRDAAVDVFLTRLAASRSAWNAADIRGEVEQLIAAHGIVADAAVRMELAEDLTARALHRCVPLLMRDGVPVPIPEHIRGWTSQPVLDVEAQLNTRLAARSADPGLDPISVEPEVPAQARLDAGQAVAVSALAGERQLVVVEGAAGAGKTTTLAATRLLLEERGRGLVVVTPTLKAAKIAQSEIGAAAGSAAWLAYQHGWRWNEDGAWTRLQLGQSDPVTGRPYAGPKEWARLRPGDLLVVDEAGMLDQDTARALLTIADECRVRVALLGDRRQLTAVGRGGVLDIAARHVDPAAHLTLDQVHRFLRADASGVTAPDTEYAELTLAMRAGEDPGAVFDALVARGQIRIHPDADTLREALAGIAADPGVTGRAAVVADTREQVAELNAAIRERLVAAGRVENDWVVTTSSGQRIGAGDRVATRGNDSDLGVANRDQWVITAVSGRGAVVVTPADGVPLDVSPGDVPAGERARVLPAGYVTQHLELAYASTVHGVQGDTVAAAHLVIGEHTGAAAAYVGMTRGRHTNTAHLLADDLAEAREQWIVVFAHDRADLGPASAAEQAAKEAVSYAPPRPLEDVLADLHEAQEREQDSIDLLLAAQRRRDKPVELIAAGPHPTDRLPALEAMYRQAVDDVGQAAEQASTAVAVLTADSQQISGQLWTEWQAQREGAAVAAHTIARGPGRLGLRAAAVARAEQRLTHWADNWRPLLPEIPTALEQIVAVAGASDEPRHLAGALNRHSRAAAERAHPESVALIGAATHAAAASVQADTDLRAVRREADTWRLRFGRLADEPDPAGTLAATERTFTAATDQLITAQTRIAELKAEPAFLAQRHTRRPAAPPATTPANSGVSHPRPEEYLRHGRQPRRGPGVRR